MIFIGGSYILLRLYHETNLAAEASPIIMMNPVSLSLPNMFRIKPARKAQITVIIPRSLFRHPKYLPRLLDGMWSAIRLAHAGPGKALKDAARVMNNMSHNTRFSLKMNGINKTGMYMNAWKKTNIVIILTRLLRCSVTSADFSCIRELIKLGKATSIPIWALVALSAMAKGVIYCSVKPNIAEANAPSIKEFLRLCLTRPPTLVRMGFPFSFIAVILYQIKVL